MTERSPFHTALHELVDAMRILLDAQDRDADLYRRGDAMFGRALDRRVPQHAQLSLFLENAREQVAKAQGLPNGPTLEQLGDAMGKVKVVLGDLHRTEPDDAS